MSSAWPPPTSTPARMSPPPVHAEVADVAISLEPIDDVASRRIRWAPIGVCALLGALVCALVVIAARPFSGGEAGDRDTPRDGAVSLAAAVTQAEAARTMEFAATVSFGGGFDDVYGTTDTTGGIDREAELLVVSSTSTLAGSEFGEPMSEDVEVVYDGVANTGYIRAHTGLGVSDNIDWISFTEDDTGQSWDYLFSYSSADPRVALAAIGVDADWVSLGREVIEALGDGPIETEHIVVEVDTADLFVGAGDETDAMSGAMAEMGEAIVASLGTVEYHVWIDDADSIRRVSSTMGDVGLFETTIDYRMTDEPLDVQLPPSGVIVSASDLELD